MTLETHLFKPSGKWHSSFNINVPRLESEKHDFYKEIGEVIYSHDSSYLPIPPVERTLQSWFSMTILDDLPIIIWLDMQ